MLVRNPRLQSRARFMGRVRNFKYDIFQCSTRTTICATCRFRSVSSFFYFVAWRTWCIYMEYDCYKGWLNLNWSLNLVAFIRKDWAKEQDISGWKIALDDRCYKDHVKIKMRFMDSLNPYVRGPILRRLSCFEEVTLLNYHRWRTIVCLERLWQNLLPLLLLLQIYKWYSFFQSCSRSIKFILKLISALNILYLYIVYCHSTQILSLRLSKMCCSFSIAVLYNIILNI